MRTGNRAWHGIERAAYINRSRQVEKVHSLYRYWTFSFDYGGSRATKLLRTTRSPFVPTPVWKTTSMRMGKRNCHQPIFHFSKNEMRSCRLHKRSAFRTCLFRCICPGCTTRIVDTRDIWKVIPEDEWWRNISYLLQQGRCEKSNAECRFYCRKASWSAGKERDDKSKSIAGTNNY